MTDHTKLLLLQLALVLGVCGFFFFFGLGAFGLVGADEPRYAQIAREMFARFPKAAYQTEIESWRVLPGDRIEFTMRRLPSAD